MNFKRSSLSLSFLLFIHYHHYQKLQSVSEPVGKSRVVLLRSGAKKKKKDAGLQSHNSHNFFVGRE
jgi:hypothetical protein